MIMVEKLKVLVACEFSGVVREAFNRIGCNAWSCDLLPTEIPGQHIQDDVLKHLTEGWDLMIAHPPCTHLAVSGARWFQNKFVEQRTAVQFFMDLVNAPIERICMENPISIMSTKYRKPDQIIQPWQFGHGETKATCLWLKNLTKLKSTKVVTGREGRVWREAPSKDRWKNRSRFYKGIADAMAGQWCNETSIPPKPKGSGILEVIK